MLELIMSVAFLSIGIVVVIRGLASTAGNAGLSSDMDEVITLASNTMQELELKERHHMLGNESICSEDQEGKFKRSACLEPIPEMNTSRSDVSLSWRRGQRDEEIHIQSYLRQ